MKRSEKLLKELRAELRTPSLQPSNESAIAETIEGCIAEVRRLKGADHVFVSRDALEAFVEYFESAPPSLMDDEKRSLLRTLKETLGDK